MGAGALNSLLIYLEGAFVLILAIAFAFQLGGDRYLFAQLPFIGSLAAITAALLIVDIARDVNRASGLGQSP